MATKTFKEICVEYAHQLGKGLPLTPAEMCNAVIMYLNAQITEMQDITSALQTAVSEAESSATEALNTANDVSETVNAIPKVPAPTASDNGKVIGVQSGVYALVEQSGGEAPANMVTTDTKQTITAQKNYVVDDSIIAQFADGQGNFINVGRTNIDINTFRYGIGKFGTMPSAMINVPNKAGTLALTDDIPSTDNFVTTDSNQSINGNKTFSGNVDVTQGRFYVGNIAFLPMSGVSVSFNPPSTTQERTITLPDKDGTVALVDDIPDVTNLVTTNTEQTITGTKTFNYIKVDSYSLTSEGFAYSGANLVRYSGSGREIRYGLSGYNSTVIGSNVKLNSDFNTSYINCTSNNIILGNSNTAINILGTRLTFNGVDIGSSSGGKLYNHYISCTVTGIGITSPLKIYFNFISTSGTVLTDMYDLAEAIKNQFLSCKGNLTYSVGGDSAIPIYITSDGSNISMGYITQDTNNIGEETLTALETFHFLDRVNEI